ncbi:MAG: helix-turn-helix transcriptional regulator [Chloroflexi bacterium]|nr:helix-turn-helix transcriptional regulator [Chloroflexota bacterium]
MTVQIIKKGDKPEWAVVPYDAYMQLVEKAEMAQDIQDYDRTKAALEHGDDELVPSEVVYAILDGGNPIKIWREYRGLSQHEMAENIGISVPYLSQLETNKRKGSLNVLSAVAEALMVSLDHIVPSQS